MIHINDKTFNKEVAEFSGIAIVKFGASWCEPCKTLDGVIQMLEQDYAHVKFCSIDIMESPCVSNNYRVMSVPTVVMFDNGKTSGALTGQISKHRLSSLILGK